MMEYFIHLTLANASSMQTLAFQKITFMLGIGIFSVSYSILALMKVNRLLACPITLLSLFAGYVLNSCWDVYLFPALFGLVVTISTLVGWFKTKRR